MRHVLDASAVLALLLEETGAERVEAAMGTACIGAVNLAEVATVLARKGGQPDQVRAVVGLLSVPVLSAERDLAMEAGLMWPETKVAKISLGDRWALALARRLDAELLTSDERLAEIAPRVGVRAVAIR